MYWFSFAFSDFHKNFPQFQERSNKGIPGLDSEGNYDRGYETVYQLMPHSDDMQPEDLLQYTMVRHVLEDLEMILQEPGFMNSKVKVFMCS